MKSAALTALAMLLILVPSSAALTPGPWKIKLTGNEIDRPGANHVYALYNRPTYSDRLGTGFLVCLPVNRDFDDCTAFLRLSRGQIIARGVVSSASQFRVLAVGGGTGLYANVGGELLMQPLGKGVILFLVDLTAF
jgi:hypothetical protein